jgi:glycosyltransferase involved in cell wall biosynthesis
MTRKPQRILFYSAVPSTALFTRVGFYATDIAALKELGFEVVTTNRLADFLKFWRYDKAFLWFYTKSALAAIIARLSGKPAFITGGADALDRESNPSLVDYAFRRLLFGACRFVATRVILVSTSDFRNVAKRPSRKLAVVHHGVDTSLYRPGPTRDFDRLCTIGWQGTETNVVRKGMLTAIRILQAYRQQRASARLVIAGIEGEGTGLLRSLVRELGQEDAVEFRFSISETEKIALLQSSGFYLQISAFEGFGVSALEALACGCAVVHSGKGGLGDFLTGRGILVPLEQAPPVTAHLMHEYRDAHGASTIPQANYQFVSEHFSQATRRNGLRAVLGG